MLKKIHLLTMLGIFAVIIAACSKSDPSVFSSNWKNNFEQTWVGPEYWANRLQDWKIKNGRLECIAAEIKLPFRTIHLLNRRIGDKDGHVKLEVISGILSKTDSTASDASTGFLIGAGGSIDYRAASLIHHSYGEGAGLFVGISNKGMLFVRDLNQDDKVIVQHETEIRNIEKVHLALGIFPLNGKYVLNISVTNLEDELVETIKLEDIDGDLLSGNIALVSHPGTIGEAARFWYNDFKVSGSKLNLYEDRNCGPIISTQHTLSKGVLKLTAQLMPMNLDDNPQVLFQIKTGNYWQTVATSKVDKDAFTASFKVDKWEENKDIEYKVFSKATTENKDNKAYCYQGNIRRNPIDKQNIRVAAFTGNHNVVRPNPKKWGGVDVGKFPWTWGVWFPHEDLVSNIKKHNPDVLFFSGDQVYEGASPTFADTKNLKLDYLYKWYLWCWAYGELTKDIPAVTIPDDHDVYHGNIWGAGGKPTPEGFVGAAAQDVGGYKYNADFVRMVETTQTSHLPDPYDPTPVAQNIGVYYCDMNYGGISFAILEDRKFKSAPKSLLPKAKIWNGWATNKNWNAKKESDVKTASLLGERQLEFLDNWASDWAHQTWMKVVLSQTIFANVATLPAGSMNGSVIPSLAILDKNDYAKDDDPVADMDSNGWPKTGRDKALRKMRKAFAFHIAGDQHLGSTIQYGVDDYHDGGFALCVPSVANFWPRRWFPSKQGENHQEGMPKYTGDYEDGFGNKMTVHAVSNPYISNKEPKMLHDLAAGYGIVTFNKADRKITMANWPRWANPEIDKPYLGWPIAIDQTENYGRKGIGFLPEVSVENIKNPVVQLINETSGEIVYTLRITENRFKAKVFETGTYTLKMGEPDTNNWKTFSGLKI